MLSLSVVVQSQVIAATHENAMRTISEQANQTAFIKWTVERAQNCYFGYLNLYPHSFEDKWTKILEVSPSFSTSTVGS